MIRLWKMAFVLLAASTLPSAANMAEHTILSPGDPSVIRDLGPARNVISLHCNPRKWSRVRCIKGAKQYCAFELDAHCKKTGWCANALGTC
jgi:hypothetical protein